MTTTAEHLERFDRVLAALDRTAGKADELRARRAEVVREALEAGITPAELAERAGLSAERVRQWHREAVR